MLQTSLFKENTMAYLDEDELANPTKPAKPIFRLVEPEQGVEDEED